MDIVVKGRNVEVPDHYRTHVEQKLARVERYDRKLAHVDVELFHEPNRRQHKNCQRVEITTRVRGQAVRAEATAGDFYAALDCAASKLENRLRRMHDRRQVHYGRRCPTSVGQAAAAMMPATTPAMEPTMQPTMASASAASPNGMGRRSQSRTALLDQQPAPTFAATEAATETANETATEPAAAEARVPEQRWNDGLDDSYEDHRPGQIVREKEHQSKPMTVDQALYEMELVGHDFYLFFDVDRGQPSVVYRRKGFDYGVIRMA